MRFSIVTPVLNGGRFLDATIRSMRAQTHDDWEHFILDGGSTDDSVEIARRHAAEDERISIVSEPDDTMYDAILKGLSRARGDILSWINSDDLYAPWAFATAARRFADDSVDWITGLPGAWDAEGRLRLVRSTAWYPRGLIRRGWFHEEFLGCIQQESIFFRRRLFDGLSEDERQTFKAFRYAGDYYLWRRFAERAPLVIVPSALGGFRVHDANLSRGEGQAAYMEEVAGTGAPRPMPRIGRRIGMALRLASVLRTHFAQEAALKEFG